MKKQLKNILVGIAPSIATALGGPMAGAAVSVLAKKYAGDENAAEDQVIKAVTDAVTRAKSDPMELGRLKELDRDFKLEMARLNNDLERIGNADRADARNMAKQLDRIDAQTLFTASLLILFGLLAFQIMSHISGGVNYNTEQNMIISRVLGLLENLLAGAAGFWFGKSVTK